MGWYHRIPEEIQKEQSIVNVSLHTNYLLWVVIGLAVTAAFVGVLYLKERKIRKDAMNIDVDNNTKE